MSSLLSLRLCIVLIQTYDRAGQECPSVSGIPMAFGAGYKLGHSQKEKEKSKDKDNGRHSSERERKSENGDAQNGKHARSSSLDLPNFGQKLLKRANGDQHQESLDTPTSDTRSSSSPFGSSTPDLLSGQVPSHNPSGGWSAVLEDWLVHGTKVQRKHAKLAGSRALNRKPTNTRNSQAPIAIPAQNDSRDDLQASASLPTEPHRDIPNMLAPAFPANPALHRAMSDGHYHSRGRDFVSPQLSVHHIGTHASPIKPSGLRPVDDLKRGETTSAIPDTLSENHLGENTEIEGGPTVALSVGPYELAVKERMMGIYLAVYVHRDVSPLLKGICPSSGK